MAHTKGVQVLVRVRPFLDAEVGNENAVQVINDAEIVVFKNNAEFLSSCDGVLGVDATQTDLYKHVQGGVLSALEGYNCTVLAYGQTGTGKTYSMLGPPGVTLRGSGDILAHENVSDNHECQHNILHTAPQQDMGIIPRALHELFQRAKEQGRELTVACSFLEVYNDRIYDLLHPYKRHNSKRTGPVGKQRTGLEVREDKAGAICVPQALVVKVTTLEQALALLEKGSKHRAIRHTDMNQHSSRSHAIFQVQIEQFPSKHKHSRSRDSVRARSSRPNSDKAGLVTRSKVNFVDLAGSERWAKGSDMTGARVGEMTAINTSLSALTTVVAALTEGGARRKHIPYRDSKITHLLQDSLGGNCCTMVVATVSPSIQAFDETISTLKFADRVRGLQNNPVVNTSRDMCSVLELKEREIQRLRQLLSTYMQMGTSAPAANDTTTRKGSPDRSSGDDRGSQTGLGGDDAPGEGKATPEVDAEFLIAELDSLRHALQVERKLRVELQAQLREGTPEPHTSGDNHDGTTLSPSSNAWAAQQQQTPQHTQHGEASRSHNVHKNDVKRDVNGQVGAGNAASMPFKAVLTRRAELGLVGASGACDVTSSPKSLTAASGGSSWGSSGASLRRSSSGIVSRSYSGLSSAGSLVPSTPPGAWSGNRSCTLGGTSPGSYQKYNAVKPHTSLLDSGLQSLRGHLDRMAALERHNKERLAALVAAGRASRSASVSPGRRRSVTNMERVYGSSGGSRGSSAGRGANSVSLPVTPQRPVKSSEVAMTDAASGPGLDRMQSDAKADKVILPRGLQIIVGGGDGGLSSTNPAAESTAPVSAVSGGGPTTPSSVGWGRRAIMMKQQQQQPQGQSIAASDGGAPCTPQARGPESISLLGGAQHHVHGADRPTPSVAWGEQSATAAASQYPGPGADRMSPSPERCSAASTTPRSGWGRSALLATAAASPGNAHHSTAPCGGGVHTPLHNHACEDVQGMLGNQPQQQHACSAPCSPARRLPARGVGGAAAAVDHDSARHAGDPGGDDRHRMSGRGGGAARSGTGQKRLDKGSLIYILGSSANSIKAKALAISPAALV